MSKSLFNRGFTVSLGATAIALSSAATVAQSPLLEEVLVTAQKREQSVNDIGMAI